MMEKIVRLIVSAYKWKCPNCEANNKEVEIKKSRVVACKLCHKSFIVGPVDY